jgi:hypothetical protein
VLGVGALGIPSPDFPLGRTHDAGMVVRQWTRPGDGDQPDTILVVEHCAFKIGIGDDGQVGHRQDPSAFVAVGVVEDG